MSSVYVHIHIYIIGHHQRRSSDNLDESRWFEISYDPIGIGGWRFSLGRQSLLRFCGFAAGDRSKSRGLR
jgi:hypothetical protein